MFLRTEPHKFRNRQKLLTGRGKRGKTGLYRRGIGAADGNFCAVPCHEKQTACLFTQRDDIRIGNPVGAVHLQALRLANLLQRIGKTQQDELTPARGDDFGIMVLY